MKKIINRMRRVRGQMERMETSIAEGVPCDVLLPQLLAIKGSVDAAIGAYVEASLTECVSPEKMRHVHNVLKVLIKKS